MKVVKHIEITEELVENYAKLIGDFNPIHLDEEYAKTTIFKSRIAHGMLVSSFISSIIASDFPGPGSIYSYQDLKFIKPCYVGDKLKYIIEQTEVVNNKFELSTKVYNHSNELILDGSARVLKK